MDRRKAEAPLQFVKDWAAESIAMFQAAVPHACRPYVRPRDGAIPPDGININTSSTFVGAVVGLNIPNTVAIFAIEIHAERHPKTGMQSDSSACRQG